MDMTSKGGLSDRSRDDLTHEERPTTAIIDQESAYMYSYPHKTAYGTLENIDILPYISRAEYPDLYFHVPFCSNKCGYCNLFSVAGLEEECYIRYTYALCRQFQSFGLSEKSFRSLTMGGGTPLILPEKQLERILSLVTPVDESCVETAPDEATAAKLQVLKDFNVGRVSLGVQSMHESELAGLGRARDVAAAHNALERLKLMDFPCVNVDLIYGIPGQDVRSFCESLKLVLKYDPEEIFIYPLYIRAGTALYEQARGAADGDSQAFTYELSTNGVYEDMYFFARELLLDYGYVQLSMRRFAKKAPISPKSCGLEDMIGIGCGARSYLGDLHFCSPFALGRERCIGLIEDYIRESGCTIAANGYILDEDERKRRFVIKNLMYYTGLSVREYLELFHLDPVADFPIFNWLRECKLVDYDDSANSRICLTSAGMAESDFIGPMFISDRVKDRMKAWRECMALCVT
jgi:oxygen-independent coproporphyrinogen-3 oxidase